MSTLQPPFDGDGRLDLDVVRSGNYDICEDKQVRAALIAEAEAARDLRELLSDALAAVEVPSPVTVGDNPAYHSLLESRASIVRAALSLALEDDYNVGPAARFVRDRVAADVVDYKTTGGAR